MAESDAGKVAAPADGHWDAAQRGADQVAQGLAQVEAFVGVFPHAVDGMGVVRLTNALLECHLQNNDHNVREQLESALRPWKQVCAGESASFCHFGIKSVITALQFLLISKHTLATDGTFVNYSLTGCGQMTFQIINWTTKNCKG